MIIPEYWVIEDSHPEPVKRYPRSLQGIRRAMASFGMRTMNMDLCGTCEVWEVKENGTVKIIALYNPNGIPDDY